ncbi:type II secretion system F family protein [Olsenella sp. Marseille-P4559]|uniref:type II secretion system F family protein n=1 Tax=Olsenella sp. Marseille-P4559 TaxID=2364795 RepID=UPI001F5E4892|nr:type II secretion system F family protein [Olsenella sp. Marseille-P4559]
MEVVLPLMAAVCSFVATRVLVASGERDAKTLVSRMHRSFERWAARRLESLGRSRVVAALLEGEDWSEASRALAGLSHEGQPTLRRESACAALLVAGIGIACVGGILFLSPVSALALAVSERVALSVWRSSLSRRRAHEISQEMPGVFRTLSVALGAGQTLAQAIEYVGSHGHGPVAAGFASASLGLRCGESTEDVLEALSNKLEAPGMGLLTTALVISHRTGSPLRDLLSRSAALVERQGEFERELEVKTAQVRLSARIVCGLPFLMVALLAIISPDFQRGLVSPVGMGSVTLAAFLDALAVFVIRRLMGTVL